MSQRAQHRNGIVRSQLQKIRHSLTFGATAHRHGSLDPIHSGDSQWAPQKLSTGQCHKLTRACGFGNGRTMKSDHFLSVASVCSRGVKRGHRDHGAMVFNLFGHAIFLIRHKAIPFLVCRCRTVFHAAAACLLLSLSHILRTDQSKSASDPTVECPFPDIRPRPPACPAR